MVTDAPGENVFVDAEARLIEIERLEDHADPPPLGPQRFAF
jgi:hypothetical protein